MSVSTNPPFVSGWLRLPQRTLLRKAVFQVHLSAGLLLGFYIAVVCVSGSAVVFRNDIYINLSDKVKVVEQGQPLSQEQLARVLQAQRPGYVLRDVTPGRDGEEATEVMLSGNGSIIERLVNPYTGNDMGPAVSHWFRLFKWLGNLHGNLLLGPNGMTANSIGGGLTALLALTGIVVWWPGTERWRRSLTIRRGTGWRRMNWDLHSAIGFWTFALLFMWGTTAFYFVYSQPFRAAVDFFTPINPPRLPQVQRPPGSTPGSATFTVPRRRAAANVGRQDSAQLFAGPLRQFRGMGNESAVGAARPDARRAVFFRSRDVVEPRAMARAAQAPQLGYRAVHGDGLNFDPSASRRKSVLVTKGTARFSGSVTIVVTVKYSSPLGSLW